MKRKWWHDKVNRYTYTEEFSGFGWGWDCDLRGIISKLDYLKDLGIDIICFHRLSVAFCRSGI